MPSLAPGNVSLETVRRTQNMRAKTPPPTPNPEISLERSRIGAPQVVMETFLVAKEFQNISQNDMCDHVHTQLLFDCTFALYAMIDDTRQLFVCADASLISCRAGGLPDTGNGAFQLSLLAKVPETQRKAYLRHTLGEETQQTIDLPGRQQRWCPPAADNSKATSSCYTHLPR